MTTSRLCLAIVLLLAPPLSVASAHAKPSGKSESSRTEQARDRAKRGYMFYDVGKYVEASVAFEEAYTLRPDAGLLFNAAQAARLGGDLVRAQTLYSTYVSFHPDGANIAEAKLNLEKIDAAKTDAAKTDAAKTDASAKLPTTTDKPAPVAVIPRPDDPPVERPAPHRSEEKRPLVKKWWFWTAIVAGVVVAGGAATLGVVLTRPAPAWNNLDSFGPGIGTKTNALTIPF